MKYFVIFLVFFALVGTNVSFAQYFGQIESYDFFIFYEGQHEIRLQSSVTKFNDVSYDELANAIIISVESNDYLADIISIHMNYSSFRTLIADENDIKPSDALVLLDGEEQVYETPRITNDNVLWQFENKPNVTEIELILEPDRYQDNQKQDSDFRYPPGSSRIEEQYPVKQQYKMGLKFEDLKCNKKPILIQKYDGTPACVTESTKEKLIERNWIKRDMWTAEYDESNPTVIILPGAVIEDSKALDPEITIVVLGQNNTVTWVNSDDVAHTLTSNYQNDAWWTGVIKPGESSSVTFNNTGIFSFHGTPGPWITGTVIVLPNDYDESSLPSSSTYDFERMRMHNACTTEPSYCFGVFENGTQIMIQCDFPIHGCGPRNFDDYVEAENEN